MSAVAEIAAIGGVQGVDAATWDALAGAQSPFACHDFFASLEESGSAVAKTGWQPLHLVARDAQGVIHGIAPLYGKSHSMGEYVFDQSWAQALERAGIAYYPKLQLSVPFTPATGPRLLTEDDNVAAQLIGGVEQLASAHGFSSAHATFLHEKDIARFSAAGWLLRHDIQFHWHNQGWRDYEDFLSALASRKRKALRKERAAIAAEGLEIVWLQGAEISDADWDDFWVFYMDTTGRKWGRPYLTRDFFAMIGARMADRILLILAKRDGKAIAGALNFIGSDALYGRYWGCREDVPGLHFELCYHQAIDFALAHGLARVEAGAQGPHKLARGYVPTRTTSAHWIAHEGLRAAVAQFLAQEKAAIDHEITALMAESPYRRA